MADKHSTRELAENRNLWDEYIDPNGEGDATDDFNTMTTDEKMRMIVEIWPYDVPDWDDEGQAILADIRSK